MQLVSVRGLGLPGVSDVDTLGYAGVDASPHSCAPGTSRRRCGRRTPWRAASTRASWPRRWLLGEIADAAALRSADLHDLDAFRLKTQAGLSSLSPLDASRLKT